MPTKLTSLPSTKELITLYKLETNKKLGQNFLLDGSITDRILSHIPTIKSKTILEIGAGPGGLTRSILAHNPKKLYAIEYDPKCIPILQMIAQNADEMLEVVQADALRWDENSIDGTLCIIANLPYNIGSHLIVKWLSNILKFEFIVVMLQKEVAERMLAHPGDPNYGRLSIICQALTNVDILMEVEPYHFHPAPKVTSSVVRLIPKELTHKVNLDVLGKVTQAAFGMRRKKVKTSLASIISEAELVSINIDPHKRAEDLSVEEYIRITCFKMR